MTRSLPDGENYWQSDTVMKLPVKWCSIEAMDDRIFSEASDVWAFGVVLWEILRFGILLLARSLIGGFISGQLFWCVSLVITVHRRTKFPISECMCTSETSYRYLF